jgi:ribosomal protein L31
MKADIHPTVYDAKVTCASCGTTWDDHIHQEGTAH